MQVYHCSLDGSRIPYGDMAYINLLRRFFRLNKAEVM